MVKKINTKFEKLIKYYSLINYDLVYGNQAINRYKNKDLILEGNKEEKLKKLKYSLKNIKNCHLK